MVIVYLNRCLDDIDGGAAFLNELYNKNQMAQFEWEDKSYCFANELTSEAKQLYEVGTPGKKLLQKIAFSKTNWESPWGRGPYNERAFKARMGIPGYMTEWRKENFRHRTVALSFILFSIISLILSVILGLFFSFFNFDFENSFIHLLLFFELWIINYCVLNILYPTFGIIDRNSNKNVYISYLTDDSYIIKFAFWLTVIIAIFYLISKNIFLSLLSNFIVIIGIFFIFKRNDRKSDALYPYKKYYDFYASQDFKKASFSLSKSAKTADSYHVKAYSRNIIFYTSAFILACAIGFVWHQHIETVEKVDNTEYEKEFARVEQLLIQEEYDRQKQIYDRAVMFENEKAETDIAITVSYYLDYNNSVGGDWYYEFYVNGNSINPNDTNIIHTKFGGDFVIESYYAENDSITDSGYSKNKVNLTKEQLKEGYTFTQETVVRENRGRYADNTAKWITTYTLTAIMNYPEPPNRDEISFSEAYVVKRMIR